MSDPTPSQKPGRARNDSLDCVIVVDDEPGDTTHRPASPETRAFLQKERDRMERAERMRKEQAERDQGETPPQA